MPEPINIDDIIQSSIDPEIWKTLPTIKKIKILYHLDIIQKIIHSHNTF